MKVFKMNLRNMVKTVAILAACMMFQACPLDINEIEKPEPEKPEKKSSEKQITSFGFSTPSAAGVINESAKSIAVEVPYGTNVTALAPSIAVSAKAIVSPASGIAQNFNSSVIYTVTAEDGSTASYTVTIKIASGGPVIIELTSPITTNTTLKDLGLPVDYVWNGDGYLLVQNNATLTIEPGVTIKITKKGGGINITESGQIIANGTTDKRIQFIGEGASKGSWESIYINSNKDNSFKYCDFINGGSSTSFGGVVNNEGSNARLSMTYCTIDGSLGYGYFVRSDNPNAIIAFNNNRIKACNKAPIHVNESFNAQKFDMTSDLSGCTENYINVANFSARESGSNITINQTNVPFYFDKMCEIRKVLTIKEGVSICLGPDGYFQQGGLGALIVNGTESKPVTFSRLPGVSSYYWGSTYGSFIFYTNTGSVLNWCVIEHSKAEGAVAIWAEEAQITLNYVTIRNNQKFGVNFVSKGTIIHKGVNERFSNNASGNVRLYGGTVSSRLP